jgi:Ran-binding protein 1
MADTKEHVSNESVPRKDDETPDAENAGEAGEAVDGAPATEEDFSKTFDPLVVLTEVETKTGEEEEAVVFKIRAKLFRFDKERSEWKERGTGDVRLLKHKETNKIRLLMRREKTLKICMNHYVNSAIVLSENVGSDRSWVFQAVDYADGEADEALLAIRFANSENANLFRDQYDAARDHMRKVLAGEPLPEVLPDAGQTKPDAKAESAKHVERTGEPTSVTAKKQSTTADAGAPAKAL